MTAGPALEPPLGLVTECMEAEEPASEAHQEDLEPTTAEGLWEEPGSEKELKVQQPAVWAQSLERRTDGSGFRKGVRTPSEGHNQVHITGSVEKVKPVWIIINNFYYIKLLKQNWKRKTVIKTL